MAPIPILLISDSVSSSTGLGRICRELAVRIHAHLADTFEVATCGFGGTYSQEFPWKQYTVSRVNGWQIPELPFVARDFFRGRKGILFFVMNQSWLEWVAEPELLPDGDLKTFLQSDGFEKWIYCPIDAEGPNGKLVWSQEQILMTFDRILAYTEFGAKVIAKTLGFEKVVCDHLPHGTDDTVFYPRSRKEARACFLEKVVQKGQGLISDEVLLLSVIATNTQRKNYGLAFEVCGELLKRGINVGMWCHTDSFQKAHCWDLLTLADSFGMKQRTIFTNSHLDDDALSWGMAASDVVLGIGDGEGWGLVNSSALACGIPFITGDYAGAAEFTPEAFKIKPVAYRYEGYYCNKRPVFNPKDWADKVEDFYQTAKKWPDRKRFSLLLDDYLWKNCWPAWAEWLVGVVNG